MKKKIHLYCQQQEIQTVIDVKLTVENFTFLKLAYVCSQTQQKPLVFVEYIRGEGGIYK